MITPDYYKKFQCIGGECLHNCCKGSWDIEIDDDSLDRFNNIKSEYGAKVRAAINYEEQVFKHKNGSCPLLTDDGWCGMVENGEEICIICDEYPRFTEYFEDYCERGISISCEAAADIILNNKNKLTLVGTSKECNEPIFKLIYKAREAVFEILSCQELDIFSRMRIALDYTAELQEQINRNDYESDFLYSPRDYGENQISLSAYTNFLKTLDILTSEWHDMIEKVDIYEKNAKPHKADELKAEQIALYFVFRYFLKGAFDCDVLSKMKFAILSVMTIVALENAIGDLAECARLYSIEIEHADDNIEAIYDEFLFNNELGYDKIMDMIF